MTRIARRRIQRAYAAERRAHLPRGDSGACGGMSQVPLTETDSASGDVDQIARLNALVLLSDSLPPFAAPTAFGLLDALLPGVTP